MSIPAADAPVFALVDDHIHSARLMRRALSQAPAPARLVWLGRGDRARRSLERMLDRPGTKTPELIIVDLKSHSLATETFLSEFRNRADATGIPMVAVTDDMSAAARNRLLQAGARAVFERHHELKAYLAEMASLTTFWIRETVTWPIRA